MRAGIKGMPAAAWILFAGMLINRFGSFVVPFLVLYLTREGFSIAAAGVALSAYGVGTIGSSALGGYLADRLGRRNTIALSMLSSGAFIMALASAHDFPLIVALSAFVAFTADLIRPAAAALLADVVPAESYVTGYALYRLAINIGFAAGPAVGGFIADRSFYVLFAADAATSVVFGLLALFALPQGQTSDRATETRGEATRSVLGDRGFLLFLLAMFLGSLVYMQGTITLPLHVRDAGYSSAVYGVLLSLNGLIVVALELPIVSFTRRAAPTRAIALGLLLIGVGFGMYSFSHIIPLMVAAVAVWTLGEIVHSPVAIAFVSARSPRHLRGRYQAAAGLMQSFAAVAAPVIGTAVYAARPAIVWAGCVAAGVVAAVLALRAGAPR